ncbi:MAG TPA: DUF2793 domain-containing protein [Allosphingosinicella sp.]|nr:DUF2793 domain-containing protein [Allosphingosinicella sp.]
MSDASSRFGLPFILPGQAQKEFHHNEALALLDAALHATVEEGPAASPPDSPAEGESWIVGESATGAWAGQEARIASWTEAGWRFVAPVPGMLAWNLATGYWLHWSDGAWSEGELPASALHIGGLQVVGPRLPEVPSPSGGTIIDNEARTAIDALIEALRSHGLTD